MSALFLEPLDVLFLRGNKLFGDPGSFGEALVPPWPSVAAGALRSRMLADAGVDLAAFARGQVEHPALGSPQKPGPFSVVAFHVARRAADGRVELLMQPPADLVISEPEKGPIQVKSLTPTSVPKGEGIASSAPLPLLPVLAEAERSKPASGYWLTESGWRKYLRGETPAAEDLVKSSALWSFDHRVGVGLDAARRRAEDGKLFSMQAVALKPGVGFVARVAGAEPPTTGTVRLGGDGRAAALHSVQLHWPEPDYDAIAQARRCRLVLVSPGIFERGWLPTGTGDASDSGVRFELHGVRGHIVCAAVPRAEVVSGWDLAHRRPKPAQRVAPTGSVYWLELGEGVTAQALRELVNLGLWTDEDHATNPRRAEGFNRAALALWS
ncbi:CRISPR-associated protein, Cmr3 family [Fontimonas thermophila]|uniref:CRISPR-associated protein, Cmr3 family n=1 Tax=Fontimonas thermophila TaxID=1076937 RepID=A0A1I2J3Y4_9GAMM|nr:type III-B CRISPR module-associated protein Cmr3 [Fontimonas thermophila]SFF47636.1 CRISPR-associated protein, Cmr3 family [Fontimonas thermophila]